MMKNVKIGSEIEMEEMNLTDEIIKALEFKAKYDAKVAYVDGCACKRIRVADILDLIRSFQQRVSILEADNDEYKMKIAENELVSIDWHYEQIIDLQDENNRLSQKAIELEVETNNKKAEIERLTREYERIAYNKQEYLEWVDGFLRTHTVMKDRGEDYKMFDREWMCNTFWAKIESSLDYIIDLENQRRELQEQVDELKEENAQLSEMADYDKGHKEGYEHGEKTTAKEILILAEDYNCGEKDDIDNFMLALKERYGVEVE
jgi:hypothetical protein